MTVVTRISLAAPPQAPLALHDIQRRWAASQSLEQAVVRMARIVHGCLCGGEIRAWDDPDAITVAVAAHNRSTRHEAWAIKNGYRDG